MTSLYMNYYFIKKLKIFETVFFSWKLTAMLKITCINCKLNYIFNSWFNFSLSLKFSLSSSLMLIICTIILKTENLFLFFILLWSCFNFYLRNLKLIFCMKEKRLIRDFLNVTFNCVLQIMKLICDSYIIVFTYYHLNT